jgi:hypothetical protein
LLRLRPRPLPSKELALEALIPSVVCLGSPEVTEFFEAALHEVRTDQSEVTVPVSWQLGDVVDGFGCRANDDASVDATSQIDFAKRAPCIVESAGLVHRADGEGAAGGVGDHLVARDVVSVACFLDDADW